MPFLTLIPCLDEIIPVIRHSVRKLLSAHCVLDTSKCRDGTVNKIDRVSVMEWRESDGTGDKSQKSAINEKLNNRILDNDKYNEEVKTLFSLHSAPSFSFPPYHLLMFSNNLLHPILNRPFPSFVDPLIPPPLLSCDFITFVYLSYLSQ